MAKTRSKLILSIILILIVIGLSLWAFNVYRNEQIRLEQQKVEAGNKDVASKIVKETYDGFFNRLRGITSTSGSFSLDDLLNGSDGKYVSESVKHEVLVDKKNTDAILGCRSRFSDKLTAEGYTFGSPVKKNNLYIVSVVWSGDADDSSDRPSRGSVVVDVGEMKIVKFDCSEQEALDQEKKINAEKESLESE